MNWANMLHIYNNWIVPTTVNIMIGLLILVLLIGLSIATWSLVLCHRHYNEHVYEDKYTEDQIDDMYLDSILFLTIICLSMGVWYMNSWKEFLYCLGALILIWIVHELSKPLPPRKEG